MVGAIPQKKQQRGYDMVYFAGRAFFDDVTLLVKRLAVETLLPPEDIRKDGNM